MRASNATLVAQSTTWTAQDRAELCAVWFALIQENLARVQYRRERKHPEWIDLGGEG